MNVEKAMGTKDHFNDVSSLRNNKLHSSKMIWTYVWHYTKSDSVLSFHFGRVEVVDNARQLRHAYFTIGKNLWQTWHSALAREQRDQLLANVRRGSPNDRLGDFMQGAHQVIEAVEFNNWLSTQSRWKYMARIILWGSKYHSSLSILLTLSINIALLSASRQCLDENDQICLEEMNSYTRSSHYMPIPWSVATYWLSILHLIMACIVALHYWIHAIPRAIRKNDNHWKYQDDSVYDFEKLGSHHNLQEHTENVKDAHFHSIQQLLESSSWLNRVVVSSKKMFSVTAAIFRDFTFIYYLVYVALSALGLFVSPYFFTFHVLDVIFHLRLVKRVLSAAASNANQLVATALVGVLIVWIYAVIHFTLFRENTPTFSDGIGNCNSMIECILSYLEKGIRSGPVFTTEELEDNPFLYIISISYHLIITIIFVAIITGLFLIMPSFSLHFSICYIHFFFCLLFGTIVILSLFSFFFSFLFFLLFSSYS